MPFSTLSPWTYSAEADFFRALGHPVRIRIIELLVDGERSVSILRAEIGIEAPSLSQHLAVLKRTGLVVSSRRAGAATYLVTNSIVDEHLGALRTVLVANLGGLASPWSSVISESNERRRRPRAGGR